MANHLKYETSPYLLQHAENPVDWYPWGEEAFRRARDEDKPIFLSIGYSTCHWCHVMAHESFEDLEIAELLNRWFISIKVDREERPDLDSVYMTVCQAFTGSGGWPASIFLTPEKQPFFAGTYFPKHRQGGMVSFKGLLTLIHETWEQDRPALLNHAKEIVTELNRSEGAESKAAPGLPEVAVQLYKQLFDSKNGGFGNAPKFPSPHNLLFLLVYYRRRGDSICLEMVERTLLQMYRGGLFDHIGGGFCRYSTDGRFLAPRFEKMLYDNALLTLAYCEAYTITRKELYLLTAERTADFVLREMTAPEGGFTAPRTLTATAWKESITCLLQRRLFRSSAQNRERRSIYTSTLRPPVTLKEKISPICCTTIRRTLRLTVCWKRSINIAKAVVPFIWTTKF